MKRAVFSIFPETASAVGSPTGAEASSEQLTLVTDLSELLPLSPFQPQSPSELSPLSPFQPQSSSELSPLSPFQPQSPSELSPLSPFQPQSPSELPLLFPALSSLPTSLQLLQELQEQQQEGIHQAEVSSFGQQQQQKTLREQHTQTIQKASLELPSLLPSPSQELDQQQDEVPQELLVLTQGQFRQIQKAPQLQPQPQEEMQQAWQLQPQEFLVPTNEQLQPLQQTPLVNQSQQLQVQLLQLKLQSQALDIQSQKLQAQTQQSMERITDPLLLNAAFRLLHTLQSVQKKGQQAQQRIESLLQSLQQSQPQPYSPAQVQTYIVQITAQLQKLQRKMCNLQQRADQKPENIDQERELRQQLREQEVQQAQLAKMQQEQQQQQLKLQWQLRELQEQQLQQLREQQQASQLQQQASQLQQQLQQIAQQVQQWLQELGQLSQALQQEYPGHQLVRSQNILKVRRIQLRLGTLQRKVQQRQQKIAEIMLPQPHQSWSGISQQLQQTETFLKTLQAGKIREVATLYQQLRRVLYNLWQSQLQLLKQNIQQGIAKPIQHGDNSPEEDQLFVWSNQLDKIQKILQAQQMLQGEELQELAVLQTQVQERQLQRQQRT